MVTTDDLDAILIEAAGRIQQGAAGVVVSTDNPVALRHRLYPRMDALELAFTIRIPPAPLSLHILPKRPHRADRAERKESTNASAD